MQAPNPGGQGNWLDSYLPEGQLVQYHQPQFINMGAIRGILFRQRWLVAGVLLVAAIGGLIVTLLSTPM